MNLDKDNIEFFNAVEFVEKTDKILFLTGKAGTGKTTFLKYIRRITNKNTVVLAPTGVAAINAGGVTINSFFQIPFGPFIPEDSRLRTYTFGDDKQSIYNTFKYNADKLQIIKNLDLLIIDEISMVRCDTLDVIDRILKVFRKKLYLPFGGVQVILIGDPFQLPPIAESEQWEILSQFYRTTFFFSSKIIEANKPLYIELKKIYRQNEIEFIDLLNKVRINNLAQDDFKLLNSKYNPNFSHSDDYIILATHNRKVNETNLNKLNQLNSSLFTYEAVITGVFPDSNKPTEESLKLKEGAQIMFVKNDVGEIKKYYNGKLGKIKSLTEDTITVNFDDEDEIEIERTVWENITYKYNAEKRKIEQEVIGTFEQFPIRLAWSITVHKSQGLTFDKVIADLDSAFSSGQVYVALSRCTSMNGLVLKSKIHPHSIKTDENVIEFAKSETPTTLINDELISGKADYLYKKSRYDFSKGNINGAIDNFHKAIKFRNDLETETFRKFITIHCQKFFSLKAFVNKNFIQITKKENGKEQEILEENELDGLVNNMDYIPDPINLLKDAEIQITKLKDEIKFLLKENLNFRNNLLATNDNLELVLSENEQLKFDVFQQEGKINELSKRKTEVKVQHRKPDEYSIIQLAKLLNVSTHRIFELSQILNFKIINNPNSKFSQEIANKIISKYFNDENLRYNKLNNEINIVDTEKNYNSLLNEIKDLKNSIVPSEKKSFFKRFFLKK